MRPPGPSRRGWAVPLLFVLCACAGGTIVGPSPTSLSSPSPSATAVAVTSPSPPPTATLAASPAARSTATPTPTAAGTACTSTSPCETVQGTIARISPARLNDHLQALTAVGSRDPRHPGHAKAVAYIKEQLGAVAHYGWKIESQRTSYQGIPLENIFASIGPNTTGDWVLVMAHYDSIANRTPGWRPAIDPAPGADDNATGTAALLEFATVLSSWKDQLRSRVVLGFFDGEELFYKGSAAYVQSLPKPYPYRAAINLDMVGFNPIADRLDLLWHTSASAGLRDRVIAVNQRYAIGVSPLNAQAAPDGNTIMDGTPFGLAGIPSVSLCQRYGENDATFPGNYTFHTTADTPDKITNPRLWLKATKLTLAVALELAAAPN